MIFKKMALKTHDHIRECPVKPPLKWKEVGNALGMRDEKLTEVYQHYKSLSNEQKIENDDQLLGTLSYLYPQEEGKSAPDLAFLFLKETWRAMDIGPLARILGYLVEINYSNNKIIPIMETPASQIVPSYPHFPI